MGSSLVNGEQSGDGKKDEGMISKPETIFDDTLKKDVCLKAIREEKGINDDPISSGIGSVYIDLNNIDKSSLEFSFKSKDSGKDERICTYFVGDIVGKTYNCTTTECFWGGDYSEDIDLNEIDWEQLFDQ